MFALCRFCGLPNSAVPDLVGVAFFASAVYGGGFVSGRPLGVAFVAVGVLADRLLPG